MRKTSFWDELIFLPWWANLLLAVAVYVFLKAILPGIPTETMIQETIYKTLTSLAGMISFLFILTALAAGIRQYRSKELFRKQATSLQFDSLTWQQFERLVGEAYRRQGYTVAENTAGGADGGIDLVLRKAGKKTLVQCKHWRSRQVGVSVVRELYGVMAADQADSAIVVCSGVFTPDARDFAKALPIQLVDGNRLERLIVLPGVTRRETSKSHSLCPRCGSVMVKRHARKGRNAGQDFLGCSNYPACRGTRNLEF